MEGHRRQLADKHLAEFDIRTGPPGRRFLLTGCGRIHRRRRVGHIQRANGPAGDGVFLAAAVTPLPKINLAYYYDPSHRVKYHAELY